MAVNDQKKKKKEDTHIETVGITKAKRIIVTFTVCQLELCVSMNSCWILERIVGINVPVLFFFHFLFVIVIVFFVVVKNSNDHW